MKVKISGKILTLNSSAMIGEGGEAEVYKIDSATVVKIFKTAKHPSFKDCPEAQQSATLKIKEHQKKLPAFPKGLPKRILGPSELAYSPTNGEVVGYTMPFLKGCESLLMLSQRSFREASFGDELVVKAFRDLHATVLAAHSKKFIFGDFNDLNGLVKPDGSEVWMLDADSAQFGGFNCMLYTVKFVDPLCAKPNQKGSEPILCKPHNEMSDWYAFAYMLMQSWLYVGPFGGVYRPSDSAKRIPHDMRSLKHVTVWDSEVTYPKPARPLNQLPADVAGYMESVFRKDRREVFPLSLLESLERHALGITPAKIEPIKSGATYHQVQGMKAERMFVTTGRIAYAIFQSSKLRWVYCENGKILREDGTTVLSGDLQKKMRVRIFGSKTVLAQQEQAVVVGENQQMTVDVVFGRPMVDTNAHNVFFMKAGALYRRERDPIGNGTHDEFITQFVANQTMFWVSDDIGFGFYRAGGICTFFTFNPNGKQVKDTLQVPAIQGNLIDAQTVFGKGCIWFMTLTQEGSRRINRCHLIDNTGEVLSSVETSEGDGSWLSSIRGKLGIGRFLFVSTDDGIVRVELQNSTLVPTKSFPETSRFVDSDSIILPSGSGGIAVVKTHEIWNLTIS